jgi:MinD superfamily P-loop ATPase
MRIAVASGKGGTGKTAVAVGLALSAATSRNGRSPPLVLDCDVEAPDAHIYLQPEMERTVPASVPVPEIDPERCQLCGDCAEACRFNALALLGQELTVFPELCHSCGSCLHICQHRAIRETPRVMGVLEEGASKGVRFAHGVLNVGEAMAVPLIRQLKEWQETAPESLVILDSPPGTSCPVVETLSGVDFVVLVTEPTPFGLHDLQLAVELVRALDLPMGVIVNRDGIGDDRVERYCAAEGLRVLLKIPFDREIAEGMARARSLPAIRPEYLERFRSVMEELGV